MLVALLFICSCSSNKSFLHQRYTHFGHKRSNTVAEARPQMKKEPSTPLKKEETKQEEITAVPETASAKPEKLLYTKALLNRVIVPVVTEGTGSVNGLFASNSKAPGKKLSTIKTIKLDGQFKKAGLLWGVIDGILAIIMLAIFVGLVLWLLFALNVFY